MPAEAIFVSPAIEKALHSFCRVYGDDVMRLIRNYYGKPGKWEDMGRLASLRGARDLASTLANLRVLVDLAGDSMEESPANRTSIT